MISKSLQHTSNRATHSLQSSLLKYQWSGYNTAPALQVPSQWYPYIYTFLLQGHLQVFERLHKALKSNDCTTKCGHLLSRESLLVVEGCLMKRLVYTIKRKNMHTSSVIFGVLVYLWLYNAPSWVSHLGSSLVRLLYPAEDRKSTLSLISSSAVPLCPLWSRASL